MGGVMWRPAIMALILVLAGPASAGLQARTQDKAPGELFWAAIENSDNPELFRSYIDKSRAGLFAGRFVDKARTRLGALTGERPEEVGQGGSEDATDPDPGAAEPASDVEAKAESDPANGTGPEGRSGFERFHIARTVTVRKHPRSGAAALGKLVKGDSLEARVSRDQGPWYKIVTREGRKGFVFGFPFGEAQSYE